jgi:Type II secretion system (T2SS), protein M subtype b
MNTLALKWAQMNQRDRRAVILLAPVVAVILLVRFLVFPVMDVMDDASRSIPVREKVLRKYRALSAAVPSRENDASSFDTRLAEAEKGLLASRTAPLAAAEVQQQFRDLASAADIQLRAVDFLPARKLTADYATASVSTQFTARMEQVMALLNGIQNHPRTLTVEQLRITSLPDLTKKQVIVTMVVSGAASAEIAAAASTGAAK